MNVGVSVGRTATRLVVTPISDITEVMALGNPEGHSVHWRSRWLWWGVVVVELVLVVMEVVMAAVVVGLVMADVIVEDAQVINGRHIAGWMANLTT